MNDNRIRTLLMLLPTLVVGCSSYEKDLRMICDAPEQPENADSSPSLRAQKIAKYVDARVRTKEAKELFAGLSMLDPEQRRAVLGAEVKKAAIASCPMLDSLPPPATSARAGSP